MASKTTATSPNLAAGGFGIGAYMAYDELQQYVKQKDLANIGLASDPSMVWLVVAVVGAIVDMGAAAKALRAIGPAADALKAGGEVKDFSKALRALQEAGEIDAKIAAAAEKAAMARAAYKEASGDLTKALTSKLYSFPGPFTDPDVYKALVKMAKAKIEQGAASITEWFHHVKQARAAANLDELTPEELAKLKQAWAEAQRMVANETGAIAKYGDSMAKLLARPDLPASLRDDIVDQVAKAMNNPAVDEQGVRSTIRAMRTAEKPHNVREFLAELRHVNEVSNAKNLAKDSKVYSGVKSTARDGSLRTFDMGGGVKVNIHPVSEADALYRAGGKVHLDEVKNTASALVNKLREKPKQFKNMVEWRGAAPNRAISVVVESQRRWTNLLGTPDVFKLLIKEQITLKLGGHIFDPAALKAFYDKIHAMYDAHRKAGGTAKTFMELPEMATLEKAFAFVGYPS